MLGHVFDHYVIDGRQGDGVYSAHHRRFPTRRYAVTLSTPVCARFARAASRLAHPNIVGVVGCGTTLGTPYFVTAIAEGERLSALLERGPMAPDRVIHIAQQLCDALDHAHRQGLLLGNVTPSNILVGARDRVWLVPMPVGCTTPEQLRGEPIDHRIDLYGLGATMFEMLSGGIPPFGDDTSKASYEAPSIITVAPSVPPALVALVGRLLASDPAARPRSALAVVQVLEGALQAPR